MHCLIIGYGSIGARHASILSKMDHKVHLVSKKNIKDFPRYKSIKEALKKKNFDYVIISNETGNHYKSFMELCDFGYTGKILIEKPIFSRIHPVTDIQMNSVFVAYNLRFHPVIQKLREVLQNKQLYSIYAYVGQYLPVWRPGTDYTKSYSASKVRGGGVLSDLSHELDFISWLCGGWKRVTAIGGKFSDLIIDSDDIFVLLLEMGNCPVVCVQMNYLDHKGRRELIINLKGHTIKADLIHSTFEMDGKTEMFEMEENQTYTMQHTAILKGDYSTVCTLTQGIDVLKLIQAAELASKKQEWINRSALELTS